MRSNSSPSARRLAPADKAPHHAILIDGSALYLASRALYEGSQLDYRNLVALLVQELGIRPPDPRGNASRWVMWTSASPQNAGQTRFLDFAENDLNWEVRRFSPSESYMVDPSVALGLSSDSRAASRLVRFDASIAFAIGRLAGSSRIVVVSDSFALADPLLRSLEVGPERAELAFFGRALDTRWQRYLRRDDSVKFLDLDEFEFELFGTETSNEAADRDLRSTTDFVF